MVEVKKGTNESAVNLIRRFTKRIQESGILTRARSTQFKKRKQSALKKRVAAVKKAKLKEKIDYLRKLGKIE